MVWDIWKVIWPGEVGGQTKVSRGGELDLVLEKEIFFPGQP